MKGNRVTSANNPATGPEQGKPPQIEYDSRLPPAVLLTN